MLAMQFSRHGRMFIAKNRSIALLMQNQDAVRASDTSASAITESLASTGKRQSKIDSNFTLLPIYP